MVYLLFSISLIAFFLLLILQYKTKIRERKLLVVKSLRKFIGIFCLVALFYSLLQLWIDSTTNIDKTTDIILQIELAQFKIKDFISPFKILWGFDLIIIVLLIAFAGFLPFLEQYKLKARFKKYKKTVKILLYILTISTSFTFFGNSFSSEMEGKVGDLEFHKLQIIKDNKLLLEDIRETVSKIVINEILKNQDINALLDSIEAIDQNIKETKNSDEFKNYKEIAPIEKVNKLAVLSFEKAYKNNFNFTRAFNKIEKNFKRTYANRTSNNNNSNFYTSKKEQNFSQFKKQNSAWYNEKTASKIKTENASRVFLESKNLQAIEYSKYYSAYKEPIDKLIKKGYSKTAKKWITSFFELFGAEFPLLKEFIDPIINEPIEDYITNKSEKIFKNALEGNTKSITEELNKSSSEFRSKFDASVKANPKFNKLGTSVQETILKSKKSSNITKVEIAKNINNADSHLRQMNINSRWEGIRNTFSKNLNQNRYNTTFTTLQLNNFKKVLKDWNDYKAINKLKWYFNNESNLEQEFFNYSKNKGKTKACWGYILQQVDWNGAVNYYTWVSPDAKATGKPYYLLKYYYNTTGNSQDFEGLYDNKTDNWVGKQCPPH